MKSETDSLAFTNLPQWQSPIILALVEAGECEIQSHPQLYSEFEASLGYERNKTWGGGGGILRKTSNLAYI